MNKIPVFGTIAHAYGFAIGKFIQILGITWAPLAVSIALSLMLMPGFAGNHMPIGDPQEAARQTLKLMPFTSLISLVISGMIASGLTELALGLRSGVTFVYFSVSAAVWRLVASWLLVFLLMIVLIIGGAVAFGLIAALGATVLKTVSQATTILAVSALLLVFYAAFLYTLVRLTFLIPPVVVSEKKIDLARGWMLTRGNFWRIFLIGLALFIPLIAVGCAAFVAVYGTDLIHTLADTFTLAVQGAKAAVIQQRIDTLAEAMRAKSLVIWPYMAVANLLVGTFWFGLVYGASAFAYRAVMPEKSGMQA